MIKRRIDRHRLSDDALDAAGDDEVAARNVGARAATHHLHHHSARRLHRRRTVHLPPLLLSLFRFKFRSLLLFRTIIFLKKTPSDFSQSITPDPRPEENEVCRRSGRREKLRAKMTPLWNKTCLAASAATVRANYDLATLNTVRSTHSIIRSCAPSSSSSPTYSIANAENFVAPSALSRVFMSKHALIARFCGTYEKINDSGL